MNEKKVVPGNYECGKCGFVGVFKTLYINTGTIGASTDSDHYCPNDGFKLKPLLTN